MYKNNRPKGKSYLLYFNRNRPNLCKTVAVYYSLVMTCCIYEMWHHSGVQFV